MADGRPVRWSETLTKQFLARELRAGHTPAQIAGTVGCSESTVRDQLVAHGLLEVAPAPKSLARDYARRGSITAVAARHGVSFTTARRWLLAANVELQEAHRPQTAPVDIDTAARRYQQGESLAAIAADFGVGVNTLKRRLEAHGVTMRPRGRRSTN